MAVAPNVSEEAWKAGSDHGGVYVAHILTNDDLASEASPELENENTATNPPSLVVPLFPYFKDVSFYIPEKTLRMEVEGGIEKAQGIVLDLLPAKGETYDPARHKPHLGIASSKAVEMELQQWHKELCDDSLVEILADKIAYLSAAYLDECVKVGNVANPLKYFLFGDRSAAVEFAALQNFSDTELSENASVRTLVGDLAANGLADSPPAPNSGDGVWEAEKSAFYKGADPLEYLEKFHPDILATILKVGTTTATPTTKETLRQSEHLERLSKLVEFISQLKATKVNRTSIRLTNGTLNTSNAYWYLRLGDKSYDQFWGGEAIISARRDVVFLKMIPVKVKAMMQRGRADAPAYESFVVTCPDIQGQTGVLVAFLDSNGELDIKTTAEVRSLQFVTPSLDEKGAFQTVSVKRKRAAASSAPNDPTAERVGTYSSKWLRTTFSSALGLFSPTTKKKKEEEDSDEDQNSVEILDSALGKRATRRSIAVAAKAAEQTDNAADTNTVNATDGKTMKDKAKKFERNGDSDGSGGGNGKGKRGSKRIRLGDVPNPTLEGTGGDTAGQSLLMAMKTMQEEFEKRMRSEFEQKAKALEKKSEEMETALREANLQLNEERRLREEDAEKSKKRLAELAKKKKDSRTRPRPAEWSSAEESEESEESEAKIPPKKTLQEPPKKGQKRKHQFSSSEGMEVSNISNGAESSMSLERARSINLAAEKSQVPQTSGNSYGQVVNNFTFVSSPNTASKWCGRCYATAYVQSPVCHSCGMKFAKEHRI